MLDTSANRLNTDFMPTINEWINNFTWFDGLLAFLTIATIVFIRESSSLGILGRMRAKKKKES